MEKNDDVCLHTIFVLGVIVISFILGGSPACKSAMRLAATRSNQHDVRCAVHCSDISAVAASLASSSYHSPE